MPRRLFLIFLILVAFVAPVRAQASVAPGVAGALSIVPGLGQAISGNVGEGALWFVTSLGLFFSGFYYPSQIGFKLWEYNMYDAYRDAGARDAAQNNVFQNYIAFLNPLNILDPVGVGILGVGTYSALTSTSTASLGPRSLPAGAFFYGFVGLGEEGLFRGFLFPGLSSVFSSKLAGAAASSMLFSLSHLTNSQPYYHSAFGLGELFILGLALCWETNNNANDLRHGIFTHTWYDFIVDYAGKKSGSQLLPGTLGLKMSIPF